MQDALNSLTALQDGRPLSAPEMTHIMRAIMSGAFSNEQIATVLTILAERGETVEEIVGAARVLREKAHTINAPLDAVDCCGTGGDGAHTYNISTAVALVAAACGVPMAKHGNRAASSKSGAADVLEALGVNLDVSLHATEDALATYNFTFLMAPRHHEAMKHVVPVRKALGFRTIFNILGPLANPAGTKRQLLGVFDRKWMRPLAESLHQLGSEYAMIVHGSDGLDEITVTGPTHVTILDQGRIEDRLLTPEDFGLPVHAPDSLKGGAAAENAAALTALLHGAEGAYRDIVLANTAAVLHIHTPATDLLSNLQHGVARARTAIDSGAALTLLQDYAAFTQARTAA